MVDKNDSGDSGGGDSSGLTADSGSLARCQGHNRAKHMQFMKVSHVNV